jgi:hypothetical protein
MRKREEISVINSIDQISRNKMLIQVGTPVRNQIVSRLRDNLLNELLDQLYMHTAYYLNERVTK